MGVWRIQVGRETVEDGRKTFRPISDWADAQDGTASFHVDLASIDTKSAKVVAKADLVSPIPGYTRTAMSRPLYVAVLDGKQIEATLDAYRVTGEAPLRIAMTAALEDRLQGASLGEVLWKVSADDGATWTDEPSPYGKVNATRLVRTFERGTWLVKAELVNRNSGARFETQAIKVVAYDVPKVVLDGPRNVFVGSVGRHVATLSFAGQAIAEGDAIVEWSTDKGESWLPGTTVHEVTRDEPAKVPVYVRARRKDSPVDEPNAWGTARATVAFNAIRPPRVRIIGPSRVEKIAPARYRVTVTPPYPNMDVSLGGEWILPDGSLADGSEIEYEPTDEEVAAGVVELSYRAWVDGYRDRGAEITSTKRIHAWEYRWPTFGLDVRPGSSFAPTTVRARVYPVGFTGKLESPVYEWTLPEGAVLENPDSSNNYPSVRFDASKTGVQTVKVKISDARGNTTEVEQSFELSQPPPLVAAMTYRTSNEFVRAPVDFLVRPSVTGGHPEDRVESYTYSLDGAVVEKDRTYPRITVSEPGEHTIRMDVRTRMGGQASVEQVVTVAPNKNPTCSLITTDGGTGWRFQADCKDEDGGMASYQWTIDGEPVSSSYHRVTVMKSGRTGVPHVTLVGIDDSGGASPLTSN
jgi:hypothetical protein